MDESEILTLIATIPADESNRYSFHGTGVTTRDLLAIAPKVAGFTVINLTDAAVSDQIMEAMIGNGQCPELEILLVSGTQITDRTAELVAAKCRKVKRIDISATGITDEGVRALSASCSELLDFDCSFDAVSDTSYLAANCRKLTRVSLAHIPIGDEWAMPLCNLPGLQSVNLTGTLTTSAVVRALLEKCSFLAEVYPGDSCKEEEIDALRRNYPNCTIYS